MDVVVHFVIFFTLLMEMSFLDSSVLLAEVGLAALYLMLHLAVIFLHFHEDWYIYKNLTSQFSVIIVISFSETDASIRYDETVPFQLLVDNSLLFPYSFITTACTNFLYNLM